MVNNATQEEKKQKKLKNHLSSIYNESERKQRNRLILKSTPSEIP
jgi:hypothetical protein